MEPEGLSMFNPSIIQNNHAMEDAEQALQDAEEAQEIEAGIERELAELSEPDLDDDDEESVMEPMNRFQEHQPQFYQNSTPFSTQSQENVILHGSNEGSRSNEQLEILYNARGMEIQRLKEENLNLTSQFSAEIRQLKHENTLLKGQSGKNQINFEHYQNLASVQSEENQTLRREIDDLKAKLIRSEAQKSEIQSDNDSKKLMIESLQIQLGELQKSDTILRAKKQHEETLRSLKERHENQIFQLEQEIDRLNSQVRKFDQEMDLAHGKLRKNQLEYDKILMEKSDTIKDLQDRLDASQKRFANFMMENSSYSNLKLINEKFQSDKENFAREICNFQMEIEHLKSEIQTKNEQIQLKDKEKTRLKNDFENLLADKSSTIELLTHKLNDSEQKINRLMRESLTGSTNFAKEELERLKNELMDRDVQILKLKADLEEAQIKYSTFKKRVKLVQTQWKNKEERLKENLKTSEEDFKAKLLSLRDKMQEVYDTKLNEIETEMMGVQKYIQDELAKCNVVEQPNHEVDKELEEDQENKEHSTDQLTKLLQNAKLDLRDRLKRPTSQERAPFAQLNN